MLTDPLTLRCWEAICRGEESWLWSLLTLPPDSFTLHHRLTVPLYGLLSIHAYPCISSLCVYKFPLLISIPVTALGPTLMTWCMRLHGLYPTRLLCPWRFSSQEYWSGLPCPSPGDLPDSGIEPESPALQMDSLPVELSVSGPTMAPHSLLLSTHSSQPGDMVFP